MSVIPRKMVPHKACRDSKSQCDSKFTTRSKSTTRTIFSTVGSFGKFGREEKTPNPHMCTLDLPSDTKLLLTKNYSEIITFRKITNLTRIPWRCLSFLDISIRQNASRITKNNSQGILFATISCQRVLQGPPGKLLSDLLLIYLNFLGFWGPLGGQGNIIVSFVLQILYKGTKKNNKPNFSWRKWPVWDPLFGPRIPPKKFMWVPFWRSFPGNEAHTLFRGAQNGVFWGGGQKVYVEKFMCFFPSPNHVGPHMKT